MIVKFLFSMDDIQDKALETINLMKKQKWNNYQIYIGIVNGRIVGCMRMDLLHRKIRGRGRDGGTER